MEALHRRFSRALTGSPAPKIATATVAFVLGALKEPPRAVGGLLQRELSGLWSARRDTYRIVYELNEAELVVNVIRIEHHADVYRPK